MRLYFFFGVWLHFFAEEGTCTHDLSISKILATAVVTDCVIIYIFAGEVHDLFSNAGLEEIQNLEDRRLQVNRGKKVAMHRVWMQSKYRKLYPSSPS